ncbi:MAG: hypothetical protein ACRDE2_00030 [Chitinophagaceae bacterium]
MKKLALLLFGIGAFTGGAYLYQQLNIAKNFAYRVVGFAVQSVSVQTISIVVGFELQNKSNFSVNLTSIYLKGYLQGVLAATISNNFDIRIPSNGVGNIQLNVDLLNQNILTNALSIASHLGDMSNYDIDLVGYAYLKTFLFPVKIPIKYSTTGKDLSILYKENFG